MLRIGNIVILVIVSIAVFGPNDLARLSGVNGDDTQIVLFNRIDNCKATEYFDVNYFTCRLCDPQLYLEPSQSGQWKTKRMNHLQVIGMEELIALALLLTKCRREMER